MSTIPVKIRLYPTMRKCYVEIDGKDLTSNLNAVDLHIDTENATTLTLSFVNLEVVIDGEVNEVIEQKNAPKIEYDYGDGKVLVNTTRLGSEYHERTPGIKEENGKIQLDKDNLNWRQRLARELNV